MYFVLLQFLLFLLGPENIVNTYWASIIEYCVYAYISLYVGDRCIHRVVMYTT